MYMAIWECVNEEFVAYFKALYKHLSGNTSSVRITGPRDDNQTQDIQNMN
jgi:hypothetical protein